MARKYRSAPKSRRRYGRKSRAVSRVPRNAFTQTKGTVFTLSRSIIVSADSAGKLEFVLAMGNIQLRAPKSFDYDATTGAADAHPVHTDTEREWPSATLGNIKAVFSAYRPLKHTATFTPICIAGDTENAVPVESCVQSFAVDSTTAANTLANPLTSYGQAASSRMHAPSNGRMPSMTFTAYPSKTSITDRQLLEMTNGLSQADLVTTGAQAGAVNSGRTFSFLKLHCSDCKSKQALFRLVEKIQILCTSRVTS